MRKVRKGCRVLLGDGWGEKVRKKDRGTINWDGKTKTQIQMNERDRKKGEFGVI